MGLASVPTMTFHHLHLCSLRPLRPGAGSGPDDDRAVFHRSMLSPTRLHERPSVPTGAPPRREWLASRRLRGILAAFLIACALTPSIRLFTSICRTQWTEPLFESDLAVVELSVREMLRGQRLVGMSSRAGWSHPGPALFELLAPFYVISRHASASLIFGAVLLNLLSLLLALLVALRTLGFTGLLSSAVGALCLQEASHARWIGVPWPPFQVVSLVFLALFLCAALARGSRLWALAFSVVASIAIQIHVGVLPTLAVCGATALALNLRRKKAAFRVHIKGRFSAIVGSVLLLCAIWVPPLLDEIDRKPSSGPGNLTLLGENLIKNSPGHPRLGWRRGVALFNTASTGAISAIEAPLRSESSTGDDGRTRHLVPVAQIAGALLVALLAASVVIRPGGPLDLSLLALAALAGSLLAASKIPGAPLPYLLTFTYAVNAFALVAILEFAAAVISPRLSAGATRRVAIVACCIVAVIATRAGLVPDFGATWRPPRDLSRLVRAAALRARSSCVSIGYHDAAWPQAVGIFLALQKEGLPSYADSSLAEVVGHGYESPGECQGLLTSPAGPSIASLRGQYSVIARSGGTVLLRAQLVSKSAEP
jgi:hypothetical protein